MRTFICAPTLYPMHTVICAPSLYPIHSHSCTYSLPNAHSHSCTYTLPNAHSHFCTFSLLNAHINFCTCSPPNAHNHSCTYSLLNAHINFCTYSPPNAHSLVCTYSLPNSQSFLHLLSTQMHTVIYALALHPLLILISAPTLHPIHTQSRKRAYVHSPSLTWPWWPSSLHSRKTQELCCVLCSSLATGLTWRRARR